MGTSCKRKIILADDHGLVRDGIRHLLARHDKDSQIFEACNFSDVLRLVDTEQDISLILLDLIMPGMEGLSSITCLRNKVPSVPIAIISFKEDYSTVYEVLELGVKGFIPKSMSSDVILSAVQLIANGGVYIPEALLQNMPGVPDDSHNQDVLPYKLTRRQCDILKLIATGSTNKEIGRSLGVSEATVRTHTTAIFKILNVTNRTQAVHVANQYKLA